MSREIVINKYEGNTHYSVNVIDSYGKEHHLGYLDNSGKYNHRTNLTMEDIDNLSKEIWANEVKPEVDLMAEAIKECVELDKKRGIEPNLE